MKKKSAIRQLFLNGPCSLETVELNDEQKRLLDELADLEEQINKKLDGDQTALDLFKRFKDALDDLNFEEMCLYFERGVKFSVLLGMELAQE